MFRKSKSENVHKFENQPNGTEDVVNIRDIIIPPEFAKSEPCEYKKDRCRRRYYRLGHLDSPISVIAETNENGQPNKLILVDGYTRMLLARRYLRLDKVPIKYIDINIYQEPNKRRMRKQNVSQYMNDLGVSGKNIEDIMNYEKENVNEGICC